MVNIKNILFITFTLILISCGGGGGSGGGFDENPPTYDDPSVFIPVDSNISCANASNGNDPLAQYQWHLSNSSDTISAFNNLGNIANITAASSTFPNLNLPSTWPVSANGEGIKIAIADDGLNFNHSDLFCNFDRANSCNFIDGVSCTNKDPIPELKTDSHGTMVAGIIGASANNSIGVSSIAPKTSISGLNILKYQSQQNFIRTIDSDTDINNESYGYTYAHSSSLDSNIFSAYRLNTELGRGGKGKIFVRAAGNGFSGLYGSQCAKAHLHQVSCHNANMDPEQSISYSMVVGALNHDDVKTSYSTAGSNLWMSAYGGDDFYILTTHLQGVQNYDGDDSFPSNTDNSGDYSYLMNGTSAASPMVAGVVALMLQANSELTWREVKYVLAKTAVKVDDSIASVVCDESDTSRTECKTGIVIRRPWQTNSAGFNFHNWYGFGKADATAAINMASEYQSNRGNVNYPTLAPRLTMSDLTSLTGLTASNLTAQNEESFNFAAPSGVTTIETVEVGLYLSTNSTNSSTAQDFNITLVSPNGSPQTESIILNLFNAFNSDLGNENFYHKFISNSFYRESASGIWTLKIYNNSNNAATLSGAYLKFYGD